MRGQFVVIEGIDGAGTTTQAKLLCDRLRRGGQAVRVTREPSDGPVGVLIRQVLSGRVIVPGGRAPGWATMALLFAADRMDHVESEIEPFVASGGVIISDRYDASSLAYQSATSGSQGTRDGSTDWIRTLNARAMRPDLTIVIHVPAEVAERRREERGEAFQIYDKSELQRSLAAFYADLPRHMPSDRVVVVDGVAAVDAVHERVMTAYATLERGAS